METDTSLRRDSGQQAVIADLGRQKRVRELALFLGLDAVAVAEGLVDAVQRDPALKRRRDMRDAA